MWRWICEDAQWILEVRQGHAGRSHAEDDPWTGAAQLGGDRLIVHHNNDQGPGGNRGTDDEGDAGDARGRRTARRLCFSTSRQLRCPLFGAVLGERCYSMGAGPLLPAETHLRQAKIGAASQTRRTTRCQTFMLRQAWSHCWSWRALSPRAARAARAAQSPAGTGGRGHEAAGALARWLRHNGLPSARAAGIRPRVNATANPRNHERAARQPCAQRVSGAPGDDAPSPRPPGSAASCFLCVSTVVSSS